jgi:hypothetical protein
VGGEFDEAEAGVGRAAEEVERLDCYRVLRVRVGVERVGGVGVLRREGGLERCEPRLLGVGDGVVSGCL